MKGRLTRKKIFSLKEKEKKMKKLYEEQLKGFDDCKNDDE